MSWALTAAFLSGFAWAGLDIARKSLARDFRPTVVAAGLSAGLAVLFGVWAVATSPVLRPAAYVPPALVSIVLSLAIQLSILESVRRGELSRTIPLLSLTPVATALFGLAVLGERPSPRQWAGIVLVFLGAAALGLAQSRRSGDSPSRRGGGWIMLLAALCISAAAPFDKLAIAASSPALHGCVQSAVAAALLLGWLAWRGRLGLVGESFRRRPAMTVAAGLGFAALGLQLVAYQSVMVGVVETIKRVVGLVSSLIAGRVVFGERLSWSTLGGVALMATGLTLLLS